MDKWIPNFMHALLPLKKSKQVFGKTFQSSSYDRFYKKVSLQSFDYFNIETFNNNAQTSDKKYINKIFLELQTNHHIYFTERKPVGSKQGRYAHENVAPKTVAFC